MNIVVIGGMKNKNMKLIELLNEDCGCNGPQLILKEGQENIVLSEGMKYHIKEGRMLINNIYRPLSNKYFELFREARELYNKGMLSVVDDDAELLESNIGEFGIYNGMKVPLDYPISLEEIQMIAESLEEANKKKKTPPIGKPKRGGSKKFYVYVRDKGKIKKVSFGQAGMSAKLNNPKARQAFSKRHNCPQKKDRTKASYWSCRLPRYAKLLGFKTSFSGFW